LALATLPYMEPSSPSPKGHSPQFSAHICYGQMAGCIKIPLGMEVGLGQGDFVLDGNPASPPQKGGRAPPIFGPCILWPNSWMDQDDIWHGGGPWSRRHCVRWGPSVPPQQGGTAPPPIFGQCILWPNASRYHLVRRWASA